MNPNFAAMIAAKSKSKSPAKFMGSKSNTAGDSPTNNSTVIGKKKKKKKLTSPSSKILTKNNLADTDSDGM